MGAVGLLLVASLARTAGMPARWRWLTLAIAAASVVGVVLPFFDVYPADAVLVALTAGVLLPAWALWLAIRAPELWPQATETTTPYFSE